MSRYMHIFFKSAIIAVLLTSATAHAGSGEILGFKLKSCGEKNCLSIDSEKAYSGMISANYAFATASIAITVKESKKTTLLQTQDVYFDSLSQKVFIRKMDGHKNTEAIYDLVSEKLSFYPLAPAS